MISTYFKCIIIRTYMMYIGPSTSVSDIQVDHSILFLMLFSPFVPYEVQIARPASWFQVVDCFFPNISNRVRSHDVTNQWRLYIYFMIVSSAFYVPICISLRSVTLLLVILTFHDFTKWLKLSLVYDRHHSLLFRKCISMYKLHIFHSFIGIMTDVKRQHICPRQP